MLKIKSGKNLIAENKFDIKADNYAVALCLLNGEAYFENETLLHGDCVVVPRGYVGELETSESANLVSFEIDCFTKNTPSFLHSDNSESVALLGALAEKTSENRGGFSDGISLIFESLFNLEDEEPSIGNKYVDMAKRYIELNYGKQIKVEDIADYVGTDRKYLRNLFFKHLGMSTKDYLTSLRIEKAKELLADNSMAVNEISASVGYPDALAFSKLFKKQTGLSPSEYRGGTAPLKEKSKEPEKEKEDIKYFLL